MHSIAHVCLSDRSELAAHSLSRAFLALLSHFAPSPSLLSGWFDPHDAALQLMARPGPLLMARKVGFCQDASAVCCLCEWVSRAFLWNTVVVVVAVVIMHMPDRCWLVGVCVFCPSSQPGPGRGWCDAIARSQIAMTQ